PVHVGQAVPRHVIAQLFKFASLAGAALRMRAQHSATQEKRGDALAFGEQIRIHAQIVLHLTLLSPRPEAHRRSSLEHHAFELKQAALGGCAAPLANAAFAARGQLDLADFVRNIDLRRYDAADAEAAMRARGIEEFQLEVPLASFLQAGEWREIQLESVQSAL